MGRIVFWSLVVILLLMAVAAVFAGALIGGGGGSRTSDLATTQFGGSSSELPTGPGGTVANLTTIDCRPIRATREFANIPEEWFPHVVSAANGYLSGDQAAVIAVMQFEAGLSRSGRTAISFTGAVGLGQFITSTARQRDSFRYKSLRKYIHNVEPRTGPPITVNGRSVGTLIESDKATFRNNHLANLEQSDDERYEDRFDPRRSIAATAELLRANFEFARAHDKPTDFRFVYANYYNGEEGNKKYENADKMLAIYHRARRACGST